MRACEGGGQEGGAGLVGDFLEALRHDGDCGGIICVDQVRDFQAARKLVSAELRNEMPELAVPVERTKNTTSCIGLSPKHSKVESGSAVPRTLLATTAGVLP